MNTSSRDETARSPFRPQDHTFEAEVRGGLCALRCKPKYPKRTGGGIRGSIVTFSRASRLRLLKCVATIDWPLAKTGVFVTLTFPDEVLPMRARARLRCLSEWMRKIENYTGKKVSGLWRTEWLPRLTGKHVGIPMPHFHLILFTVRFIPYAVVNKFWRDSLGGVLICRTDIRRLANEKQHGYYVAKYAAKVPDKVLLSVSHIAAIDGQHWGYLRAKNLPRATQEYFLEVPWETAAKLREIAAENLPWYDKETDKGFCLLTRFGRELARKFLQTLLDSEAVSR